MGAVYRITFPNGKGYIGITVKTVEQRFASHLYSLKRGEVVPLYCAMRKYGTDDLKLETIAQSEDWATLCRFERRAIAVFGTRAPGGYNATDGGDGAPKGHRYRVGLRHSPESRAKMSASRMGKCYLSPETRARYAQEMTGNTFAVGVIPSQATINKRKLKVIAGGPAANSSGVKGVSKCGQTGMWRATIGVDGKLRCLGRYKNLQAAIHARQAAEAQIIERLAA